MTIPNSGSAPAALGVMWTFTALTFVFLLMRLYTRIRLIHLFAIDDHTYMIAFTFLLIFTAFTQVSAHYGFGQTIAEVGDMEQYTKAALYECIGQGFAIVGMGVAKWSCGAFLLRLVLVQWHKVVIWIAMVGVMIASIAQVLCFWLACRPLRYVYDRRIPGGYCPIDTRPTSYILCVSTVLVDVLFATMPWIFIWKLQMPQKDKYLIAGSMSLGIIAAAAGIKRTTTVEGLYGQEYLKKSVGLIVWSSAELALTLIGVGIPVCRPLYKVVWDTVRHSGYVKESNTPAGLCTFGGDVVGGGDVKLQLGYLSKRKDHTNPETERYPDIEKGQSLYNSTYVGTGSTKSMDNKSEEAILDPQKGITVTQTYNIHRP